MASTCPNCRVINFHADGTPCLGSHEHTGVNFLGPLKLGVEHCASCTAKLQAADALAEALRVALRNISSDDAKTCWCFQYENEGHSQACIAARKALAVHDEAKVTK